VAVVVVVVVVVVVAVAVAVVEVVIESRHFDSPYSNAFSPNCYTKAVCIEFGSRFLCRRLQRPEPSAYKKRMTGAVSVLSHISAWCKYSR
jgi:hypothetical protein